MPLHFNMGGNNSRRRLATSEHFGILLRGIPKMNRRQQLQDTLERILTALKAEYHPEQVIVFGSLASGLITDTSDLDLLIVKKTSKGFFERVKEVIALCDYDIGVDFLIYTPEELSEAAQVNPFVRDEILAKGKVVYSAAA